MNAEIRTEAAQFPEKEYINGIFVQCGEPKSESKEKHGVWTLFRS
jgi:hypothetical protein